MAKYSQNQSCGHTCPWGSGDDHLPPDAFTAAAMRAARRRESKEVKEVQMDASSSEARAEATQAVEAQAAQAVRSSRSTVSEKTGQSTAAHVEIKMMDLIQRCLDQKVLEMSQSESKKVTTAVRSSCSSACTSLAGSQLEMEANLKSVEQVESVTMAGKRAQIQKLSNASLGQFDADESRLAYLEMQKSAAEARNKNRSALSFDYEPAPRKEVGKGIAKGKEGEKEKKEGKSKKSKKEVHCSAEATPMGYEALERYPALLREVNGLADKAITQGLTSNGKQKQAMKLSDAALGKFDADQSRVAYLQMQKSAAEARNKNRSALCFGEEKQETSQSDTQHRLDGVTMAGKRAQAQKLSDASLGKFDVDQSQVAYLEMHNTAAAMRNKNRVGQGIF